MLFFLMMMIVGVTPVDVEALIVKLNPEVGPLTKAMVAETVAEYAPKAGFTTLDDIKLILSVIQVESSFVHKKAAGASGEWGMMQVIPGDMHIRLAARNYVCSDEEADKLVRDGDGYFRVCYGRKPNIYSIKGEIYPNRLARFVKHSPRAGIAIGIYEMEYWKKMYDTKYKARFWDNPLAVPTWRRLWHEKIKSELGSQVWICHYNYGGRIKLSITGYNYPLSIIKNLSAMK